MTCRIVAKITYNWPITVTRESETSPTELLFKSEGEPQTFIGEQHYDLDTWFSGTQKIVVTETQKPKTE